jgi:hypothetical protein
VADGRQKYWNGIREDVKESKVEGREKNVWSQVDADCSRQTEMEEDWRGLHPTVDDARLKIMMMMIKLSSAEE